MATIDRTTILKGPAVVIFNSVNYYTEDDITLTPRIETFDVPSSINGTESQRYSNIVMEVSFKPKGEWSHAKALWAAFANPVIGSSIYGGSDKDIVIHSLDGRKMTLKCAACVSPPELHFSTVNTMVGSVTFRALGENNVDWTDASKRIVESAQAFAVAAQNPDSVITQPYKVSWGSSPFANMETEDGIRLSLDVSLNPTTVDSYGIVDETIENVVVSARFIPVGLTQTQYLTLLKIQGAGVTRGASLGAVNSNTLEVVGTGVYAGVNGAAPTQGVFRYGRNVLRLGEVAMQAQRKFSAGVAQPLFVLADAKP